MCSVLVTETMGIWGGNANLGHLIRKAGRSSVRSSTSPILRSTFNVLPWSANLIPNPTLSLINPPKYLCTNAMEEICRSQGLKVAKGGFQRREKSQHGFHHHERHWILSPLGFGMASTWCRGQDGAIFRNFTRNKARDRCLLPVVN